MSQWQCSKCGAEIYEQGEEYVKHLAEMFGVDPEIFHPDDLSSRIIESYQRHLRGMKEMLTKSQNL